MRDNSAYSPPFRGKAAPSSAYVSPPHRAATPPRSHASNTAAGEGTAATMCPVVVNTPTPMMLATISSVPVTAPMRAGGGATESLGATGEVMLNRNKNGSTKPKDQR